MENNTFPDSNLKQSLTLLTATSVCVSELTRVIVLVQVFKFKVFKQLFAKVT